MIQQKIKTEKESYHAPKEISKKGKRRIIIFLCFLAVLSVGLYLSYLYQNKQKTITCGELKISNELESETAPFLVNLRATISGKYDQNTPVCEWFINNQKVSSTVPVNGECILSNRKIQSPSKTTFKYNVVGLKGCPRELIIDLK